MPTIRKKLGLSDEFFKQEAVDFIKSIQAYDKETKLTLLREREDMLNRAKVKGVVHPRYILGNEHKAKIIELAGKLYTPMEILRIINEKWKLKYSYNSLFTFLKRNKKIIYEKRDAYLKNISNLRLSHPKSRIEELTKLYDKAFSEGDNKHAIQAIKEIREEIVGSKLVIEQHLSADINVSIKNQLSENVAVDRISNMALLELMEKHNIDFNRFGHRLATKEIVIDSDTGKKIKRKMPIDDKEIEEAQIIEEINDKDSKSGNVIKNTIIDMIRERKLKLDKDKEQEDDEEI